MIIFFKSLQWIFGIIFFFPASFALSLMHFAGWLTQAVINKTPIRKMVTSNIQMVLPGVEAEAAAVKLINNTSYAIFEILCAPFFKRKHLDAIVKWKGLENLDKARQGKNGVILVTMHAGNYEIIAPALSNRGYLLNSVLRATDDPLFKIINRSRATGGARLINVEDENMYKTALELLAKNEMVGLLVDTGALESRHITHKFLGYDFPIASGWLTLAQRAECYVVPILAKKEGKMNLLTLYEPIKIERQTRDEAVDRLVEIFEDFIKENPEQWLMFFNSYETKRMLNK